MVMSGQMEVDASCKRAQFILKSLEIRAAFYWASPVEVLRALKIHSSSFYGAIWDLAGVKARQLFSAWNVGMWLSSLTWGALGQQGHFYSKMSSAVVFPLQELISWEDVRCFSIDIEKVLHMQDYRYRAMEN